MIVEWAANDPDYGAGWWMLYLVPSDEESPVCCPVCGGDVRGEFTTTFRTIPEHDLHFCGDPCAEVWQLQQVADGHWLPSVHDYPLPSSRPR